MKKLTMIVLVFVTAFLVLSPTAVAGDGDGDGDGVDEEQRWEDMEAHLEELERGQRIQGWETEDMEAHLEEIESRQLRQQKGLDRLNRELGRNHLKFDDRAALKTFGKGMRITFVVSTLTPMFLKNPTAGSWATTTGTMIGAGLMTLPIHSIAVGLDSDLKWVTGAVAVLSIATPLALGIAISHTSLKVAD